jgi:hypothetical protein
MDFLHLRLAWTNNTGKLKISPLHRNYEFARGSSDIPAFAKGLWWISNTVTTIADIRPFMLAKLCSVIATCGGDAVHHAATKSLALLVAEVLRMRWPREWIARILRGFTIRYRNSFGNLVRMLGKCLRDLLVEAEWDFEREGHGLLLFEHVQRCCTIAARRLAVCESNEKL